MKNRKWPMRLLSGGLVTAALLGVALASGTQGSQGDPLITLSYLTQQFTPSILSQVDSTITARETTLRQQLDAVSKQYVAQVEEKLGTSGGTSGGGASTDTASAVYQVVTLTAGQTIVGSEACEFLLRSGTATCVSDSSPGLVDMTDGTTLANGGSLAANHLYLATIEGRGVKASTQCTVMVRGGYVIQ